MSNFSSDEEQQFILNKRFFIGLLNAEKKFIEKIESMSQILSLLDMYGKCVEFFDTLGNPIKWYFMEKIAITIAEKEAFEMILKEESIIKIKRQKAQEIKPIQKIAQITYDPLQRIHKKKNTPPTIKHPIVTQDEICHSDISLHKIREVRQKKLTLTEKMYEQKSQLDLSTHLVQQWGDETEKTDSIIRQQLIEQQNHIANRIQHRRQKTLNGVNSVRSIDSNQYQQ